MIEVFNMTEIFIKYNRFLDEMLCTIDGEGLKNSSNLNYQGNCFSKWAVSFPSILLKECNRKSFNVSFCGIREDFVVLEQILLSANKDRNFKFNITFLDENIREESIEYLKKLIKNSSFEKLKEVFSNANFEVKKEQFHVNIISTEASGKSTLVNALLGKNLMPAKNETCTPVVTEIKDIDRNVFVAETYMNDKSIIKYKDCSLEMLENLNNKEDVCLIKVEGDIPFIDSDELSLVISDTPTTVNVRNEDYKYFRGYLLDGRKEWKSKPVVLYVLNYWSIGMIDVGNLLRSIAAEINSGDEWDKKRFLFAINKLDLMDLNEESIDNIFSKVKKFLIENGIENPKLFTISALTALRIRILKNNLNDNNDNYESYIRKLDYITQNNNFCLERYSSLSPEIKTVVTRELEELNYKLHQHVDLLAMLEAKNQIALIRTGIIGLEYTIKELMNEYSRNLDDSLLCKLNALEKEEYNDINKLKEILKTPVENREDIIEIIKNKETNLTCISKIKNIIKSLLKYS